MMPSENRTRIRPYGYGTVWAKVGVTSLADITNPDAKLHWVPVNLLERSTLDLTKIRILISSCPAPEAT